MKKTKGQIAGQVFIYMMAVIVIGGIAVIGYGAIDKLVKKSCDTEKATFKTDMDNLIEKRTSYGSVWPEVIKAPCQYDTICFIDKSKLGEAVNCPNNKIIFNSVKDGIQQNIFVISGQRTIALGYSDLISLNSTDAEECLCIKQRNKNFYITFSGKGASTEISRS
jgi:hypothetical protein